MKTHNEVNKTFIYVDDSRQYIFLGLYNVGLRLKNKYIIIKLN